MCFLLGSYTHMHAHVYPKSATVLHTQKNTSKTNKRQHAQVHFLVVVCRLERKGDSSTFQKWLQNNYDT